MAVAQPSANEADLLSACQARSSTKGRNGTTAGQAIDVPRGSGGSSVEVERADGHRLRDATLPLLAGCIAEELDFVAVGIGGGGGAGGAMPSGAPAPTH